MPELSNVPLLQVGVAIVNPDGTPTEWFRNAFNALVKRTGTETENTILGVINGAFQLQQQIAAEAAARIAGDQAGGSGSDGSGVSNGGVWSNGASAGATWVVLKSLTVTPGGAGGTYSVAVAPDDWRGAVTPATGLIDTFDGAWRIVEELTGGGTPHVLDSGAFTITYVPQSSQYIGEGSTEMIVIPAQLLVNFYDLPTSPLAANESAQSDIRFEIQRASGATEVSQLSGAMTVTWNA